MKSPSTVDWRVLEHTLTITHLYALFEQFFEETVAEWVDFLAANFPFHQLPSKVRSSYQAGFAKVIGKLPSPRFPTFTANNLVNDFHEALSGKDPYRLEPTLITYRSNNLRWSEICEIFGRCNVSSLNDWASANDRVSNHIGDVHNKVAEQVESRLANFVQHRNDCSHGLATPDEILGHEDLLEMIEFITAVADSLSQLISWKRVEALLENGRAKRIGSANEVFERAEAVVAQVSNSSISLGQKLYWKKGGNFGTTEIASLQVNDKDVKTIDTTDPVELGLKLTLLPKKGTALFIDALGQ